MTCRESIPISQARPKSCSICGLGPCQQHLLNQVPFKTQTSLATPEQTNVAKLAVNDDYEKALLRRIGTLREEGADGRCLSLAKTKLQEAFMWLNRAVIDRKREWPEDRL
jgi:hypothetical protein